MTYLAALKSFNNIVRKNGHKYNKVKSTPELLKSPLAEKGSPDQIARYILNTLFSTNCPNVYFLFVLQGDVKMHFKKSAMNWPQHFLYLL